MPRFVMGFGESLKVFIRRRKEEGRRINPPVFLGAAVAYLNSTMNVSMRVG